MRFNCKNLKPGIPAILLAAASCTVNPEENKTKDSPNIVFILIDDLGYKDLACYGSEFYETPNIDRLAEEGMKFNHAYTASAVCSPTRASILTGKHPGRLHITDWTGPDEWHPRGKMKTPEIKDELPKGETTFAEALKEIGYSSIYLGKWHLGAEHNYPQYHGFDISIAATNAGAPPSFFYPYFRANWAGTGWGTDIPDLKNGKEGEYLTDRLTDEALSFLDTIENRPFLLYLSHYAVHKPLQAKDEVIKKYRIKADSLYPDSTDTVIREKNGSYTQTVQKHPVYAAMIESVDKSVGDIMTKLEDVGLNENTIIIFTSDNGGLSTYSFPLPGEEFTLDAIPTSNLPLRAGKGWYYEGGIRVPTIIKWPGVIEEGAVSNALISSTDYYPTILEMAGCALMPEQHKDGISFVNELKGIEDPVPRKIAFWHYPHYHSSGQKPASAVRKGKYKLIHWIEDDYVELYDLQEDIGEEDDLSEEIPELAAEMKDILDEWREKTGVMMPGE